MKRFSCSDLYTLFNILGNHLNLRVEFFAQCMNAFWSYFARGIDTFSVLPVSFILIISKLFIMHVELLMLVLVAFELSVFLYVFVLGLYIHKVCNSRHVFMKKTWLY